jgi:hypothetical protein
MRIVGSQIHEIVLDLVSDTAEERLDHDYSSGGHG